MKKRSTPNLTVKEARWEAIDPVTQFKAGAPHPEPYRDDLRAYEMNVWVNACVKAIATNFAGIDYETFRKDKGKQWKPFAGHPLTPLMERPNPYMTSYQLRELTAIVFQLTGNAYWSFEKLGTDSVKEIWPLPPENVRIVASTTKLVDHYLFQVGGEFVTYQPNEIIHFKSSSPMSLLYGQGGVAPARISLIQDFFAQAWNKSFFQNSGRPDSILESENVLDDPVRQRVLTAWKKMHGGADKHGKVAMLEGGLKYKEVNRLHKEMDFIELRKQIREEVLAAFGVPPSMVGVFEYANYANTREQIQIFWKHTMVPMLRSFASILNQASRNIFYDPVTMFQADTSKVEALRVDEEQRAKTAKLYVEIGVPANQVIDALDLPFEHFDGGDISRPALPGLSPTGTPNKPTDPNMDPATGEPKSFNGREKASAKGSPRDVKWKKYDQALRDLEGPFESAMKGFFRGQKARVAKRLKARGEQIVNGLKGADGLKDKWKAYRVAQAAKRFEVKRPKHTEVDNLLNLEAEDKLLAAAAGKHIERAFDAFGRKVAAQVRNGVSFDLSNPAAQAWLDSKTIKLAKDVNEYTLEQITDGVIDAVHEAVSEGFDNGETIDQISARIDSVYEFADETRSERIARTEVISASNAGSQDSMSQLGVSEKEWISAQDDRVRDTHQELDGQIVGINEDYVSSSGATLTFPGDPDADPSEIINCRCVSSPVVD